MFKSLAKSSLMGLFVAMGFMQGASAAGVTTLTIGVPSAKISAQNDHLYKAGFEREVIKKACAMLQKTRCVVKEVDQAPGKTLASGLDALVWSSDVHFGQRAYEAALTDAFEALASDGVVSDVKTRFMKTDQAWPKPLKVGVDSTNEAQAVKICQQIKANCTFVKGVAFNQLVDKFNAGELQLIIHAQSWMFQSKSLEDRIVVATDQQN